MNKSLPYDPLDNLLIVIDERPHLFVVNPDLCQSKCSDRSCINFCPSQVFSLEHEKLTVNYTRCVECGACLYSCFRRNIHWEYPRGGFGVVYLY